MVSDTNKQDRDKHYKGYQKQGRNKGVAIRRRGMVEKSGGVNGGSGHIHPDGKKQSQKKKGHQRPFQSAYYYLLMRVVRCHEVLPQLLEQLVFLCGVHSSIEQRRSSIPKNCRPSYNPQIFAFQAMLCMDF